MIDAKALVERTDIVAVISAYTKLKKIGAEYAGPCPIHGGDGDNFYVNPQKRIWRCFSRGCDECDEGNDVIGFLRKAENLTFKDACAKLGATDIWKPTERIPQKAEARPDRVTSKPPAGAGRPAMRIAKLGEPVRSWDYLDADGALLGCVARYETPEGKQIRCWTWGAKGDEAPGWGCGHWTKPRPLYGLDRLAARPGARVAIVEGEKAADAAQRLLPQMVVVTWPGGANAWKHCDLEPLRGRNVLLWPDNDAPGAECMERLAALLADPAGLGCTVRVLDPAGMPDGFDAADWTDTPADLITWATPRIKPYQPNPAPQGGGGSIPPPTPDPSPPAEAGPIQDASEPPPAEFPPEATLTVKPPRPARQRPRLAAVDGNTALAPEAAAEPVPVSLSEDAFAVNFADLHGDNWRYVKAWGKWFNWDGEAWAEDRTDSRVEPMRAMFQAAAYWPEASELTTATKRALFGRKVPIFNALQLAGTDKRIRAEPEIWDADPWALGVPGGVVDLQTGRLKESARDQHVTMRCTVAPAAGKPELWLKMLNQWMGEDQDVIGFLRRYLGYALTGDSREQCMAFFYGKAQSGKGTILRTVAGILGSGQDGGKFRSYHYEAPISTFMESRSDRHTTELAAFYKKRLITSEEPAAGAKWDEGKLKWITGGSQITARFIAQDNFSFTMTGKIIVAANHRPRLATTDKAIRRRMMVIPFEHPVADEDRDNMLDAKLREEWPQILHWLIEGCLEWQQAGLGLPEKISDSTDQYLESEDTIGAWLEECTERGISNTEGATLYRNYSEWCEANGDNPYSRRGWANALIERGIEPGKGTGGRRIIKGLSLKVSAAPEQKGWAVD